MRVSTAPLAGLVVAALLVSGACQSTASPVPSSAPSQPSSPSTTPPATRTPPATPADFDQFLYDTNYQPEPGTTGGSVVIGEWQRATELNPYFSNSIANSEVLAATMRSLLTITSDGRWKPDLAAQPITFGSSVKRDSKGRGFTVHVTLKPGLKWSDGAPLTLADLTFTRQWVLDRNQVGINTFGWEHVDRINVSPDGLGADVHFPQPTPDWLTVIGRNPLLPRHYVKQFPITNAIAAYPLSPAIARAAVSGPFRYVTASPDAIVLARNDNWAAGDHAPYLDAVTFRFFADDKDTLENAFTGGAVDVALNLRIGDYAAIKDVSPRVGRPVIVPMWEYEHLDMNEAGLGPGRGTPALTDLRVRQAIAMAIDRGALYAAAFPGASPPSTPACVNAAPTNYWYLPGAETMCPPVDVAGANRLLDGAGYARGADGIRVDPKTGQPLVFDHCTSDTGVRKAGVRYLAGAFRAIGITLTAQFVDSAGTLFAAWPDVPAATPCNLARGTFDTAQFSSVLGLGVSNDYYFRYHSGQIPSDANNGSGFNYLRVTDPAMDAALTTLKTAIDPKVQVEAAYDVQQISAQQVLEVPLYYVSAVRGISARLHNFLADPGASSSNIPAASTDLWNVEDWWVSG